MIASGTAVNKYSTRGTTIGLSLRRYLFAAGSNHCLKLWPLNAP